MHNPCRKDGVDCPNRKCGCAVSCPEWAEWVRWREMTREEKRKTDEAESYNAQRASQSIDRSVKYRKQLNIR